MNEFFHLHETGVEDMLLRKRTLNEWAEIVRTALAEGVSGVTFYTSGTVGPPKRITHSWASIEQEIDFLSDVFAGRRRVISTVPAHHIYGFLFTVLLPEHMGVPVMSFTWEELGELSARVCAGDLVVSHPTLWRYLSRSAGHWPGGVWGTSSTAPLPADIHRALTAGGLERLWEIYGSTETAGVGLRDRPDAPFELFPYLSAGDPRAGDAAWTEELPDRLEWVDGRHFFPRGRVDRVVQVGGENVSLEHVEDVLGGIPGVEQAIVRTTEVDGEPRLKAFLVIGVAAPTASGAHAPSGGQAPGSGVEAPSREAVAGYARQHLRAVERPVSVTFGEAVPRNAMGKITDWDTG
ncbi:MAG: AMP-binding protein [Spirochaetes bacterium]|nr:AMP-binding protein [Spirochaetota bacterium]